MLTFLNPDAIGKPFGSYSHVVTAPSGYRWAYVSGQVGNTPDGKVAPDFETQARLAWANVIAAVRAGGMDIRDIVKVTTFLTRREDIPALRSIRAAAMHGHAPASTLLIVSGLADPELLVEIEAVAAKA